MVAAMALALAMPLTGCAKEPQASSIVVGWAGTTLPPADSLLPPRVRRDSAAIVARIVETKHGRPIAAEVAVVPSSAPTSTLASAEWSQVDSNQEFVTRVAPADYRILVRQLGYDDAATDLRLQAGAIDTLYVLMHSEPLVLRLYMSKTKGSRDSTRR